MVAECNLNIHVCSFSAFTIRDTTNLYFDSELIMNSSFGGEFGSLTTEKHVMEMSSTT